jgi:hypothetical protein
MPGKEKKKPEAKKHGPSKSGGGSEWTTARVKCPEGNYEARLLLEWDSEGNEVLKGISCDNPQFAGLDNWDCKWSCWQKMKSEKK